MCGCECSNVVQLIVQQEHFIICKKSCYLSEECFQHHFLEYVITYQLLATLILTKRLSSLNDEPSGNGSWNVMGSVWSRGNRLYRNLLQIIVLMWDTNQVILVILYSLWVVLLQICFQNLLCKNNQRNTFPRFFLFQSFVWFLKHEQKQKTARMLNNLKILSLIFQLVLAYV